MSSKKQNINLPRYYTFILILGFFMIFSSLAKQSNPQNLELVVQIFRHGARQALIENPSGFLENAGKVQLYNFGKILRERFIEQEKLLKEQFDPKEIYLHSSPKNRAMNSLFWLNSGLYPPLQQKTYEEIREQGLESIHVQGIDQELPPLINLTDEQKHKLHSLKDNIIVQDSQISQKYVTIPSGGDLGNLDTFYHAYNICPFIEKYQLEVRYTDEAQELLGDSPDIYSKLANHFNTQTNITDLGKPFDENKPKLKYLGRFLDYYACNSFMGMHLPVYTPFILTKLRQYKTQTLDMKFRPSELRKVCVTEHLYDMKQIFLQKFQPDNNQISASDLKMMLYSCHDRNLYLLMMALTSESSIDEVGYWHYVPPFASSLQIKVFSTDSQQEQDKQVFDLDKLEIEIYLNDIQMEWRIFNQKTITMRQFLFELIPQNIYPIEQFKDICQTSDLAEIQIPTGAP